MEMSIKLLDVLKDPTELGLEDHCHTDMWAIVELRNTSSGEHFHWRSEGGSKSSQTLMNTNFSIHMNQRRDLLNEANAPLILPSF